MRRGINMAAEAIKETERTEARYQAVRLSKPQEPSVDGEQFSSYLTSGDLDLAWSEHEKALRVMYVLSHTPRR